MIIRNELEAAAAKQLAVDFHCAPEDFFKYENTVTYASDKQPGERPMWESPCFFRAATMGMGAVICTSEEVAPYAKILAASKSGARICSVSVASALDRELFSHGYYIGSLKQYYLPRTPYRPRMVYEGYELTVFEGDEIEELYGWRGFDNALLYRTSGDRYDLTAVCAVNGRRIMGIAGASRDSASMAQIGIDVLPEFRGMGVGSVLVCACANEVFRQGYVPYYGTWSGNIISQRLSMGCGFYPAWTEMAAVSFGKRAEAERKKGKEKIRINASGNISENPSGNSSGRVNVRDYLNSFNEETAEETRDSREDFLEPKGPEPEELEQNELESEE